MKKIFALLAAAAMLLTVSCSKDADYSYAGESEKGEYAADGDYSGDSAGDYGEPSDGGGENGSQGFAEAGVLTAAEWNDLANWDFWWTLVNGQTWYDVLKAWEYDTTHRVAVRVKDSADAPVVNVPVALYQDQKVIWSTRTTNAGEANCWVGPYDSSVSTDGLQLKIGDQMQTAEVLVTTGGEIAWNEFTVSATAPEAKADIAFIVDATGSMTDEIEFLKEDLLSILQSVKQSQSGLEIRTGTVFYRDEGDEYVTKYSSFTTDTQKTMKFIGQQEAEGGGDYPEAVHTALSTALQKLSWNDKARARLAFLVLDAPAHVSQAQVVDSIHKSIESYAKLGIRIIPVMASSADKPTEFMCRDFAIFTNGDFVFLTDDSGVGNSHIEPTVGQYQVEKLNELLVRLINEFIS